MWRRPKAKKYRNPKRLPKTEQPFFGFPLEGKIAFAVKCPLHGDRFKWPYFYVYVSVWVRVNIWRYLKDKHSAQYQIALYASFTSDMWTADVVFVDGRLA